jgi:hypothetical protein
VRFGVGRGSDTATLWQVDESGKIRGRDLGRAIDAAAGRTATDLDGREGRPGVGRTDDEDAGHARRRYRSHGIEPLEPDPCIGPLLEPGEDVLARHQGVVLDRRQLSTRDDPSSPMPGDLYVTSSRLVHVGRRVVTIELDDVEDAALVGDRVLLITRGGIGVTLEGDRPRLLRVQMAAARAARSGPTRRRTSRPQLAAR